MQSLNVSNINFLKLSPAFHYNLFLFKEKRKSIFIATWAMAEFFRTKSLLISAPISQLRTSNFSLPTSHFAFVKPVQVQSIKKETKKHQKKFGHNDKELLSLHPARGQVHISNA